MQYLIVTPVYASSSIKQLISLLCLCFFAVTMHANADLKPQNEEQDDPGLKSVENTGFDTFLVADSFTLPPTQEIYISFAPEISFSEEWLERFPNKQKYQRKISKSYGKKLKEKLQETLADAGWKIASTPGVDTIQLNVRLYDVFITAPDSPLSQHTLVANVGSAAIELIFRTPENQPFLKIVDRRITSNERPVWADRATNHHYFSKLISFWSEGAVYFFEKILAIAKNSNQNA